jgi:hypothetical protein
LNSAIVLRHDLKNLQPASGQALPHVVDASLHAVVGKVQVQPRSLIHHQQLLAVGLLAAAAAGSMAKLASSLAARLDGRVRASGLGLAAVMLASRRR